MSKKLKNSTIRSMEKCQSAILSPNNNRYLVTSGWHEELCEILPDESRVNDCRSYFSRFDDCLKREKVSTSRKPRSTQPSASAAKKTVPDDIRRADIRADIRARNRAHNQPKKCNWHNEIDGHHWLDPQGAGRSECAKRVRQKLSLDDNDIEGVFPTLGDHDATVKNFECQADAIRWGKKFRDEMKMCRDLRNAKYGPGGTNTDTREEKAPGASASAAKRTVPDDIRRADIRADIRARNRAHNQPKKCNWHNEIDGHHWLDPQGAGRSECAKRVRQKLSLDDNDIEGVLCSLPLVTTMQQ